jgi:SAM-dependent methyltransferase
VKQEFAREYSDIERWHWWFRGRRKIFESVLRRELAQGESRRILSIGCGPAEGLQWLQPFAGVGGMAAGVDVELLHARRRPGGIQFAIGSMHRVPLKPASFDVVLALDVLEHLDDDAAGLREAVRLVKPRGLLMITVPAMPSLWGKQDVISEHRRRYTRRTLKALFDAVALRGCRVHYFNSVLFPAVAAVRWTRRAVGRLGDEHSDFDDSHPGLVNETLERLFASERHLIGRVPMPLGVSLMATVRIDEPL